MSDLKLEITMTLDIGTTNKVRMGMLNEEQKDLILGMYKDVIEDIINNNINSSGDLDNAINSIMDEDPFIDDEDAIYTLDDLSIVSYDARVVDIHEV